MTYVFSVPGWTYDDVRDFKGTKVRATLSTRLLSLSWQYPAENSVGIQVYLYSPPSSQ